MNNEDMEMAIRIADLLGLEFQDVIKMKFVDIMGALVLMNDRQLNKIDIQDLCNDAYQTALSKGWHEEPREFGTVVSLMHSELSEALEADRRHEGKERVVEELADVCIRIFDYCGGMNLNLQKAIREKMEANKKRSYKHGGKKY